MTLGMDRWGMLQLPLAVRMASSQLHLVLARVGPRGRGSGSIRENTERPARLISQRYRMELAPLSSAGSAPTIAQAAVRSRLL